MAYAQYKIGSMLDKTAKLKSGDGKTTCLGWGLNDGNWYATSLMFDSQMVIYLQSMRKMLVLLKKTIYNDDGSLRNVVRKALTTQVSAYHHNPRKVSNYLYELLVRKHVALTDKFNGYLEHNPPFHTQYQLDLLVRDVPNHISIMDKMIDTIDVLLRYSDDQYSDGFQLHQQYRCWLKHLVVLLNSTYRQIAVQVAHLHPMALVDSR